VINIWCSSVKKWSSIHFPFLVPQLLRWYSSSLCFISHLRYVVLSCYFNMTHTITCFREDRILELWVMKIVNSGVSSRSRSRNIVGLHAMRWLYSWLRNSLKKPEGLLLCPRKPALRPYSELILSNPKLNTVPHKNPFWYYHPIFPCAQYVPPIS
jgi:hypothetical protein